MIERNPVPLTEIPIREIRRTRVTLLDKLRSYL